MTKRPTSAKTSRTVRKAHLRILKPEALPRFTKAPKQKRTLKLRSPFVVFQDGRKEWRWRLVGRNGRTIGASSEGFLRRGKAIRNAVRLAEGLRAWFSAAIDAVRAA